jgi:HNH endonuclease
MAIEFHPINNSIGVDPKDIDRFLSKIIHSADTECWFWNGYRDFGGYGRFTLATGVRGGKPVQAHRFSYEVSIGTIPAGYQVHHKCNNRHCVNPNHLEALTISDHVAKTAGHASNQTHCLRGHEFTEKNTRLYNGFRTCRACVRLRQIWKYNPDHQIVGPSSPLYCKNDHPLFGSTGDFDLVEMVDGRFRRRCRVCRREASERYKIDNTEAILAARTLRRADRIAGRKIQNRQEIISLRQTASLIPANTLILVLRRLLNDCD